MLDPELEYRRLTSGDEAGVRAQAAVLDIVEHKLVGAEEDVAAAADVAGWTGIAAAVFALRIQVLSRGVRVSAVEAIRLRGGILGAAQAYGWMHDAADRGIRVWRDRPAAPAAVDEVFAGVVVAYLGAVARTYDAALRSVVTEISSDGSLPLDSLDDETRAWLERGLARNEEWLEKYGGLLGPLIPNTAATGDDRGWTPQGMTYDPASRTFLQAYYKDLGNGEYASYLAVIDAVTGKELTEVELGTSNGQGPTHAGGVSIEGDTVHVSDKGKLFSYSLSGIRGSAPGTVVPQQDDPTTHDGGSYSTIKDGRLYMGTYAKNEAEQPRMYVYERNSEGEWVHVETVPTPLEVQGVAVRDGEYVFSISPNRTDESSLVVQQRDDPADRSDPFPLPNMSQAVVEVDGRLVITYESGAGKFDDEHTDDDDRDDLWANPYMTSLPLSALGLEGDGELEIDPGAMCRAAADLDHPAGVLADMAGEVASVRLPAGSLGEVPSAGAVATAVAGKKRALAQSLRLGSKAVRTAGELVDDTAKGMGRLDGAIGRGFGRRTP